MAEDEKNGAGPVPPGEPEIDPFATEETDEEIDQEIEREAEAFVPLPQEHAARVYDRIRRSIVRYLEKRGKKAGKAGEFLLLAPDVFVLLWRLTRDRRVSAKNKVLLGTAIAYYVSPFDIIPEAIVGPIGYIDDLLVGVYVLNRILADTDEEVVRQHWSGRGDLLEMIRSVLGSADELVPSGVVKAIRKIVK
ncbi:MAG: DUF1232 domain-containing protein [Thermoanaerobaculia bacterium]